MGVVREGIKRVGVEVDRMELRRDVLWAWVWLLVSWARDGRPEDLIDNLRFVLRLFGCVCVWSTSVVNGKRLDASISLTANADRACAPRSRKF
ncbi:hypothetical protein EON65_52580 [archaeon]|nr:MAG: hypothetical protein EON65_52580 [archaeon]